MNADGGLYNGLAFLRAVLALILRKRAQNTNPETQNQPGCRADPGKMDRPRKNVISFDRGCSCGGGCGYGGVVALVGVMVVVVVMLMLVVMCVALVVLEASSSPCIPADDSSHFAKIVWVLLRTRTFLAQVFRVRSEGSVIKGDKKGKIQGRHVASVGRNIGQAATTVDAK